MILLLIDTSGPVAGVALMEDGKVRYEAMCVNSFTHSQSMLPMVEEAYLHTGLSVDKTDYFACVTGPGSFTGVRIGVSTVKALAQVGNKPCVMVDALESMANGVRYFGGILCPIQDARAGQVYGAAFEGTTMERLLPDEPLILEEYLEKVAAYGKKMLFLGDGMPVHREKIGAMLGDKAVFAPAQLSYLRPAAAAELAWNRIEEAVSYLELQPLYLRAPSAERQKNLKEKYNG
ncbi:MAG: tRNA (adenosine(37)-N6)-threonylcarbamoyltransferase complex dimerization subunit type 1 TsaB [Clostridia bacterium]|nr:tRNA (adenosine(37)-N6)-threonylcarbamoyltransferase complex dimerization subunit type 1 TsaB [Clostridia bacterium]